MYKNRVRAFITTQLKYIKSYFKINSVDIGQERIKLLKVIETEKIFSFCINMKYSNFPCGMEKKDFSAKTSK